MAFRIREFFNRYLVATDQIANHIAWPQPHFLPYFLGDDGLAFRGHSGKYRVLHTPYCKIFLRLTQAENHVIAAIGGDPFLCEFYLC